MGPIDAQDLFGHHIQPDADGDIRSVDCLDFLFRKRVICRMNRSCQDEQGGAQKRGRL